MNNKNEFSLDHTAQRKRLILRIIITFIVLFLMANLGAVIDAILHPEIEYFDSEHIIVGLSSAFVVGIMMAIILIYIERIEKAFRDHKRTEESLHASEIRYQTLFEQASDGIFYLSTDGEVLKVNESFARMHGYRVEEMQGMRLQDLDTPENMQASHERMRRILAGEMIEFEAEHYHKDGHIIPLAVSTGLISVGGKDIIQAFHRDITERRQIEKELINSEKRFHALIEHGQDYISLLAADGTLLWESPSERSLLGYAPNQFLGRNMFELIHPEDQAWTRKMYAEVLQSLGSIQEGEFRLLHADNTWRWVRCSATNLLNEPSVQAIVLNYRDITERKQAEETLRIAEADYRTIFENAPIGVFQSTLEGRFRRVNPAMAHIFGYASPEEMIASITDISCQIYVNPEDRREFQQALADHGEVLEFIGKNYRKDKSIVWTETTARAVKDAQGNILWYEGFITNITDRKHVQESLRESESKFRSLIEQSSEGVVLIDEKFMVIEWNSAQEKITGIPHTEAIGTPYWHIQYRILPPERQAQRSPEYFKNAMETALANGQIPQSASSTEIVIQTPSGERKSILQVSFPIQTESGYRIGAVVRDITARKQVEVALRDSESRAQAMLQAIPDLMFRLNSKGVYIDYKADVHDLHVQSKASIIGKSNRDISPPEFADLIDLFIQTTLKTKKLQTFEYRMPIPDRGMRDYEARMAASGKDEVMMIVRDITENKRAEEALQLSERSARQTARQLQMINQIGIKITAGLGFEQLMQTIYEQCQRIGDTDTFYIAIYDDATNVLSFPFFYKDKEQRFIASRNLKENSGLAGHIIESRKTLHLPDLLNMPDGIRGVNQPGKLNRSFIGVPLISNDMVVGVISMQSHKINTYTQEQIQTLELLATQVAIAIQNSQLYEQTQLELIERKQAEERIILSERKYRELFEVNKDGIAIFLLNPHGPPGTFVEVNDAAPQMLGYTKEEMLKLTPMMLEPWTSPKQLQLRQSEFELKGSAHFETVLMHKNGHPVFAEFSAQMIQYEGKPAIMNIVRDITERKQRETEMRAIATLSAALRTASTRAEMLPVVIEQLVILLNCDTVSVEIIDPLTGDSVTEVAHGAWKPLIGSRQKSGTGINAIISETRQPYFTNDLSHDPNFAHPELVHEGIHGGIGAPLIAQDNLIGFVWMGRKTDVSESEVRLLVAVADIAANAIHRATLHEQIRLDAGNLTQAYDTTLEGWAHALELRDHETEGHTRRVAQMTLDLARVMGIEEGEMENIRRGVLLHDIGKMGVRDSILLKPGALNEHEWEIMRQHPEYAYKLLKPIEYLHTALDIPYCHHEKWDGTGYPRGLKYEEIPLKARIFAIVDVWDALTSDRPYRLAWSKEKALAHITEQRGKHFDPAIVDAFLKIVE
ncbi:MAG: PAS domain S-box protein [Chloroflexi bacterium]|nr:PAS domain S-box protein [Chloroflexota bacterium]